MHKSVIQDTGAGGDRCNYWVIIIIRQVGDGQADVLQTHKCKSRVSNDVNYNWPIGALQKCALRADVMFAGKEATGYCVSLQQCAVGELAAIGCVSGSHRPAPSSSAPPSVASASRPHIAKRLLLLLASLLPSADTKLVLLLLMLILLLLR